MERLAHVLLTMAALLAVVGLVLLGLSKLGLGRLPGDLIWRRDGWTVSVPLGTSLLLSIVVTVLLNLWGWWRGH